MQIMINTQSGNINRGYQIVEYILTPELIISTAVKSSQYPTLLMFQSDSSCFEMQVMLMSNSNLFIQSHFVLRFCSLVPIISGIFVCLAFMFLVISKNRPLKGCLAALTYEKR